MRIRLPFETRWTLCGLGLVVLLTLVLRLPLLNVPLERDEGEYAYIAWRLGYGELPYRDWVDQKPPAIFWAYRAALALPINPVCAIHLLALAVSAASACTLFFVANRFVGRPWALTAACLFALHSADPAVQGPAANTEQFMLLPLLLSILLFLQATSEIKRRAALMVASGALTAIAIAFKQVAAVNWIFLIAAFPLFAPAGRRFRDGIAFAAWSTAGAAAVWLAISLYFLARHGFDDFIYNVFTHNFEYVHAMPMSARWRFFTETVSGLSKSQIVLWALATIGLGATAMAPAKRHLAFLAGWAISSIAGVSASGYFFPHYFQQLLPVLAVAATAGAEALCKGRILAGIPSGRLAAGAGAVAALLPAVAILPFLVVYTPDQSSRLMYPGNWFPEMRQFGMAIGGSTAPDDKVFIFGAEPEVFFYARRLSATRYIFLFPLYGPYRNVLKKQQDAAEEVVRSHPAAAVYAPNGLFFQPGNEQFFTRWSESYLQKEFDQQACLVTGGQQSRIVRFNPGDKIPLLPGQSVPVVVFLRKL